MFVVDSGGAFASGAAMTVVLLSGISDDFSLTLVLADRFTVNNDTNINTEDFLVVGSKGDYQAVGRLAGDASVQNPAFLVSDELKLSGTVCLKE